MKITISSPFALALFSALILASNYLAFATDPDSLQDYCVAVPDGHKKMGIFAISNNICFLAKLDN